jgi:hypothetical protein
MPDSQWAFLQRKDLLMPAVDTMYVVSAKSGEKPDWLLCKAKHGVTVFIRSAHCSF